MMPASMSANPNSAERFKDNYVISVSERGAQTGGILALSRCVLVWGQGDAVVQNAGGKQFEESQGGSVIR